MYNKNNIIEFPCELTIKKKKYLKIRDEVENILTKYVDKEGDLWAVALAAGRFSSMNLENIDGADKALEFFKNCIQTQKKSNLSRNPTNVS
jgi:hypothetical protein